MHAHETARTNTSMDQEHSGASASSLSQSPPVFSLTAGPAFQLTAGDGEGDGTEASIPWTVSREGATITFKVGSGKSESSEEHSCDTVRGYILKNYNWNGIVQLMKGIAAKDAQFAYTVPTDLGGTKADDKVIIPDAAIEAIIRLQAKYQIETRYSTDPGANIANILKGVDGRPLGGFASNILGTTREAVLDESDNSSMKNGDKEFKMPDLASADEKTLYVFLRDLVLSRNGLWSDKERVTNLVSIRRNLESNSRQFNDTMFVAWKDTEGGKPFNAQQYIGSTEPGNSSHGMILPQTTTYAPGVHGGGSGTQTPGGRNVNAYRKTRGNNTKYFQSGDTTMNMHYGSHGISNLPTSLPIGYNSGGKGYENDELEAYTILVELLHRLTEWGDGRYSRVSAYANLQRWAADYSRSEIKENDKGGKEVEINNGGKKPVKTLSFGKYQSNINLQYGDISNAKVAATRKDRAIKLLENQAAQSGSPLTESAKADLQKLDLKDLRTKLMTEKVWLSVIDLQLKEEVNMKNVDAAPGGGTVSKLEKDEKTAAADSDKFKTKKAKAKTDLPKVDSLFGEWDKNAKLKGQASLKTRLKTLIKINEQDIDPKKIVEVDDKGGKGVKEGVGNWSEGCNIVYGGQNYYDYLYNSSQFMNETKQQRWYYTIVDMDNIKGVKKGKPAKTKTGTGKPPK